MDFGAGKGEEKRGFAAAGRSMNDVWNGYRHYEPKFAPGMPLVSDGRLAGVKFADGSSSGVAISVTNAPGVWGNATGDRMFDSYLFAPNGSNMVLSVSGLDPGHYQFFLYGHAAADGGEEQNSVFTLRSGTNVFGTMTCAGGTGWRSDQPWRERAQFVAFRDVAVAAGTPIMIDVAPAPGGVAVLNGMQILSRGTAPPRLARNEAAAGSGGVTNILFRSVHFEGRVGRDARFQVKLKAESRSEEEISASLFEGDLALMNVQLPSGCRIVNQGREFRLFIVEPGEHLMEMELVSKVERIEPWARTDFRGPSAAVATVRASAEEAETEVQLRSGTEVEDPSRPKGALEGVLGAEGRVNLRWQGRAQEAAREAIVGVETISRARVTPSAVQYSTEFRYEILQSRVSNLKLAIPPGQRVMRVSGDLVREWRVGTEGTPAELGIELVRPVEKDVTVVVATEESLGVLPANTVFQAPRPLGAQREFGRLSLAAEDVAVQPGEMAGMRQVNAGAGEFAAFQFHGRPATLGAALARIEPEIKTSARVRAKLEEGRFLVRHELSVNAAKAGIYGIRVSQPPGLTAAEVTGADVERWESKEGVLAISFRERVEGERKLVIDLERALTNTPPEILIEPLRVAGAALETALIGAGSSPGIQVKTLVLDGVREIPVASLPEHGDELLAFRSAAPGWRLALAAERLAPRLAGEVFNLMTLGDGLVGGSATVRYAIVNQGVQQFRVRLPAHWRNVEFTGANIRRKDQEGGEWTISLQDKAWGAYTMVITYDYAFDPKQASLDASGAHLAGVERESGIVAITSAPGLTVQASLTGESARQIDPTEIPAGDRGVISRPVLLAYRYEGNQFGLSLAVNRHQETEVLDAVADRAQLTTVLTGTGEMLTQASFMVKNNERQFQRFQLPNQAALWGVSVNGAPVKAERDGDWLLVSLPRGPNRDQAFAVDIQYAQQLSGLGKLFPRSLRLVAPRTDVPGTYAGWELFVPPAKRVSGFEGNMTVAPGAVYGLGEAWDEFVRVYRGFWHEYGAALVLGGGFCAFLFALALGIRRHGFSGFVKVAAVFALLAILAGMLLPALAKAKGKAMRIKSVNNLKNVGLAARIFAADHDGRFPSSFEEMMAELGTDKILIDPETGERYTYSGAGRTENDVNTVLAFSSDKGGRREVVLGDGSVVMTGSAQFNDLMAKHHGQPGSVLPSDPVLASRYGLPPPVAQAAAPEAPTSQAAPSGGPQVGAQAGPQAVTPVSTGLGAAVPALAPGVEPMVTGVRSLRIEVPRTGRAFQFTRVLNLSGEPPTIEFSVMSAKVFALFQTVFQLATFLCGLSLAWVQWRRPEPNSLWLAAGVGLALIGTGSLLISWRMLHFVLVALVPLLAVTGIGWVAMRLARSTDPMDSTSAEPPPRIQPDASSVFPILLFALIPLGNLQAARASEAKAAPVSIVSATYIGTARENTAEFEASFHFTSAGTNQSLTLFGKEAAVQEFTVLSGAVELWREGERLGVLLPARGAAQAKMKLLVGLRGEAGRPRLEFDAPPALGGKFTLILNEPDAEVEFPAAVSWRREAREKQTHVEAVLGAAGRVSVSWSPRAKRGDGGTALIARQTSVAAFGNGVMNVSSHFDYRFTQGELPVLRFSLPRDQRLLRVFGDLVGSWRISPQDAGEIWVTPIKTAKPEARVVLELERPLDRLPTSVPVGLPSALDAAGLEGSIAIAATPEINVNIERATGLERTSLSKAEPIVQEGQARVLSAWLHRRPEFELVAAISNVEPHIEAVVRNDFVVGNDAVSLRARADYTITRAGVFALGLELPPETRVESVACDSMASWAEREGGAGRLIEIALKERTLGRVAVDLRLARALTNLPPSIVLRGVGAVRAAKTAGFVSIAGDLGIGLKILGASELAEIPVSALPHSSELGASGVLAFKHIANDAATARWQVTLGAEALESWVRAEVVNFVTASETLLTGVSVIRYDIQNAPAKEFRLRAPDGWRNVEISGHGLRRRDLVGKEWRVELQNKVRGEYRLLVNWEMPRPPGAIEIQFAGLETAGTERETGAVAFWARPPLQITPARASEDLLRIDAREIPGWAIDARGGEAEGVLNYRYVRPGWRLGLELRRFSEAALLQALVDEARFQTVVADDGQLMTQMRLSVRNNGRQHLEITLPAGAKAWSAFVDGRPVRPAVRSERLLIPLESAGDAPIGVELIYVGRQRFPRTRGGVTLDSPRFDVPLKDARWEVFLPPDYEYSDFSGTMTWERADLEPIAQDFTLAAYRRQEGEKAAQWQETSGAVLRRSRSELAAGNVKDAGSRLNLFRSQAWQTQDAPIAAEFKKLEEEVVRNQSSNLLQEQVRIALDNRLRLGAEPISADAAAGQKRGYGDLDEKVAERQVEQLQKAQSVAIAQIAPLHVNLPLRGLRHSFTQILQTEAGKPLSLGFHAQNDRDLGWFSRLLLWTGGFGVLWLLAGLVLVFRSARLRNG